METGGTKFLTYGKHGPINLVFVRHIEFREKSIIFYFINKDEVYWEFRDARSAEKAQELLVNEISEVKLEDF
jgi:hypothetical protein